MAERTIDRRTVLTAAAAASALGVLNACGSGGSKNTSGANAKVRLPSYVPFRHGATPDLEPKNPSGMPGYLTFPAHPKAATSGPPLHGGTISSICGIYTPPPPGPSKNPYWAELNKRLGTNLQITGVPQTDYATKLNALLAGNDLPDLVLILGPPPHLPQLLQHNFQDLTPHLSGDAIKEYPFLANIGTDAWRGTVYNGGIYGLPIPRGIVGSPLFVRADIVSKKQLNTNPKNFTEFKELCQGLTDPKRKQWALGSYTTTLFFLQEMLRAPNNWRRESDRFVSAIEAGETKQALAGLVELRKAGVIHPDAATANVTSLKDWFNSGTVALNYDGFTAWHSYLTSVQAADPDTALAAMIPPGYHGGKGAVWAGTGSYGNGMVALKKTSDSHAKKILAACNWLAAPFGTAEYLFRKFGIPNVDYTLKGTSPVLTAKGAVDLTVPVGYITDSPQVIFQPGKPDVTRAQFGYQTKAIPLFERDDTVGLFSNTNSTKGAQAQVTIASVQSDIMAGRKPLSAWDSAVKEWQQSVGNTIRHEYEEAYTRSR